MEYDKKIHIAQQVENFMNSFATGDSGSLERTLSNITEVFDAPMLLEKIKIADKTKKEEINKIWIKARDAIKTTSESNKQGELFIDIAEVQKDLQQALNIIEMDYWEAIRGFIMEDIDKL